MITQSYVDDLQKKYDDLQALYDSQNKKTKFDNYDEMEKFEHDHHEPTQNGNLGLNNHD